MTKLRTETNTKQHYVGFVDLIPSSLCHSPC